MADYQELYKHFIKYPRISTDTRKDTSNSIFFALSGENFNGNKFAATAIEKGACLAVIDDPEFKKDNNYFVVDDTLSALQELARIHRKKHMIPLLAITGSNGKTTTKELIAAVLGQEKNITYTQGNFNNHIGLPLTLLNVTRETEMVVAEMGANHIGEIKTLCGIALPQFGIITNIGKAHLEGFGSFEGVIKAKSELYQFLRSTAGSVLVNADDQLLMELSEGINRYTYGKSDADIVGDFTKYNPCLSLKWKFKDQEYICDSQLYGQYNFANILAAISVGVLFGIPTEEINNAICQYEPSNNRSQMLRTSTNSIILDAYNANPVSMTEAINSFKSYAKDNPWLILGDMFELGEVSLEEHIAIIRILEDTGFENVLLIGKDFNRLTAGNEFQSFASANEAATYLQANPISNASILIKGSRGMQLEKLLTYL